MGLQQQTRSFTPQQLARVLGYLMQGHGARTQLQPGGDAKPEADEAGWLLSLLESCRLTDETLDGPLETEIPGVVGAMSPG